MFEESANVIRIEEQCFINLRHGKFTLFLIMQVAVTISLKGTVVTLTTLPQLHFWIFWMHIALLHDCQ